MEFRTELGITTEMVEDAIQRGLINPSSDVLDKLQNGENTENQYILILSTDGYQFAKTESKISTIYNNIDLDTATGEGLDKLGKLVGIPRIQAQPSLVELEVSLLTAADTDITIPAGTPCRIVEIRENGSMYITREDVTINAGVTSATVVCESVVQDYLPVLPEGAVEGLEGFNDFVVTNPAPSTTGRPIEWDNEYRERIREWPKRNKIGTEECIREYLDNHEGIDAYALIPLYDGVGTLKVVCDTIESNLPGIAEGLSHRMDITDVRPPLVVQPTTVTLQSITIGVTKGTSTLTDDELEQLLIAQTKTYVQGGVSRQGLRLRGLGIGAPLYPSKLIQYLSENFSECNNIKLNIQDPVTVSALEKLKCGSMSVVIE